jgi:hypothetical protein
MKSVGFRVVVMGHIILERIKRRNPAFTGVDFEALLIQDTPKRHGTT